MMFFPHPVSKYLDGKLSRGAFRRFERHLPRCQACSAAVERDQNLRERLRASAVPEPRGDLTERILSRSAVPAESTGQPVHAVRSQAAPPRKAADGRWVSTVGSVTVIALIAFSGAYVVGSAPPEETAPVAQSEMYEAGLGWDKPALETADLEQLRSAGWNCPELRMLGFELDTARGYRVNGVPTVELVLRKAESTVTVYEQRKSASHAAGGGEPERIINVVTGHGAEEDGFVRLDLSGIETSPVETSATLWLRPGEQWEIIVDSSNARYTVTADVSVLEAAAAVSKVAADERARLALPPAGADRPESGELFERVWRGVVSSHESGS